MDERKEADRKLLEFLYKVLYLNSNLSSFLTVTHWGRSILPLCVCVSPSFVPCCVVSLIVFNCETRETFSSWFEHPVASEINLRGQNSCCICPCICLLFMPLIPCAGDCSQRCHFFLLRDLPKSADPELS